MRPVIGLILNSRRTAGWSRQVRALCFVGFLVGCATDTFAQSAKELLSRGAYQEARSTFRDQLTPAAGAAIEGYFETFLQTGAYDEGLSEARRLLGQWPDNAFVQYGRGRLLWSTGQLREAEEALISAIRSKSDYWRAGLEVADLFEFTGQGHRASGLYNTLYGNLQQDIFTTADDLAVGALAAVRLERYHDANDALSTARRLDENNPQLLLWHADLYRITYDEAQAQSLLEKAQGVNPHSAAILVALAEVTGSYARRESLARQALDKMPNSVEARSLLASLSILDGRLPAAMDHIEAALAVNPASLSALAHLATVHRLRGDIPAYLEVETRARAINARPADFYRILSEGLALRFRYPDAAAMAEAAVRANPNSATALAALGTALMRLGRTAEAQEHLDRAYERDAFNLYVANTLRLLDEGERFRDLESAHFRLRIHEDEADILGPALLREAEAAYTAMAPRYPYRPEGKILVEAYNDANDFAVRIAGVPHIGLLGVSFGDVVAINTPEAQGDAPYNWARTLWHEIAHTLAIGTSDYHVPRWLTEGLSVYEEQRAHPEWAREYELRFFMAFDQDRLHALDEIDRGFTRPAYPGQVMMSYYHAYQVVDFIAQQHGFEALVAILGALGRGQSEEDAIQETLGLSRAALDEAFRASLRSRRAALADVLQDWPDMLAEETSGGTLEQWMQQQGRNSMLGSLQRGAEAFQRGDDRAAEAAFRQALELYPHFTVPGNAYHGLASVYRRQGDERALIGILEDYLSVTPYGSAEAQEVSAWYEARGDADRALAYLERARRVEPYEATILERMAGLYAAQGAYASEVEMREALLALGPVDMASAYYHLARSLYHNGQVSRAKRAVLQSLEIAPGFREAQRLLLDCVDAEG